MGVFAMPSLGADMEAGTLVEWLVKPGDEVRRGDTVAVVETQKGAIEIECFEEGTVESLQAEIGARLPVGAPLALLRNAAEPRVEAAPARPAETVASPSPARADSPAAPAATPPPTPAMPAPAPLRPESLPAARGPQSLPADTPAASPAARAAAAERGLDLAGLAGSGPGGAIVLADVDAAGRAVPSGAAAPAPGGPAGRQALDPEAMRAAIAAAMARAKREIPHYYLSLALDLQPAADWLARTNASREPDRRLLMGALFVKATAQAASAVPEMNGHYGPEGFRPSSAVHAGVAVALRGGGLIAPAIHDAQTLTLDETMASMKELVARARTGRLRSSEMTDGTITVSSMGEVGADALTAVIYPPQVAIVGFGTPARRPWVVGDSVVPRTTVTVTLSADHRVSDGRRGAKFLAGIQRALQDPEAL